MLENSHIIAQKIVLSNIVSVVSDNTFAYLYSGSLLTSKRCIVLLHTLLAYSSLLFHYKVYSADPSECLCTS